MNTTQQKEKVVETTHPMNVLGVAGLTETSLADLHPFQQEKAAQAIATLTEAFRYAEPQGHMDGWTFRKIVDAAYDVEQAQALGYVPTVKRLGGRSEVGEVPAPQILSALAASGSAGVFVIVYTEVNDLGYGDKGTAQVFLLGRHDSLDEANEQVLAVDRAVRLMNAVANMTAQRADARGPKMTGDDLDF